MQKRKREGVQRKRLTAYCSPLTPHRSFQREPTINDDGLSGDMPRGIGAEEGYDMGDVVRFSHSPEYGALPGPLDDLGGKHGHPLGANEAWSDRVDIDAGRPQLDRRGAGKAEQRGL